MSEKAIVEAAFEQWKAGSAYISDIFADDLKWTITGHSAASRYYDGKQAFIDEVLHPFAARFSTPFRPTDIKGVYADGEMVVVLWDGEGVANDGTTYRNTYAWFMTVKDGKVVEGTAFYDSISFNDLWTRVVPRP